MPSSKGRPPAFLRWLAIRLVRGPETRYVLGDLDEAFERDVERGTSRARASLRYLRNVVHSALSVSGARRRGGMRGERVRERITGSRRRFTLGISWLDVKLGLRMLVKHPVLTAVATVTLGVGIPVGLAPTHLVNAIEAPPPVDQANRLQVLRNFNVATSGREWPSLYDFREWHDALPSFEALGALRITTRNIFSKDGHTAPFEGAEVTASTFDILRVPPLLGRTLVSADEEIGSPAVVVLGYDLWRSHLGSDPDVVGRSVRVGGEPHTVVGVMPEDFPRINDFWLPLLERSLADDTHRSGLVLVVFGRLSDGASAEEAQSELTTVGHRLAVDFPGTHESLRPQVVPFTIGLLGLPEGGFRAMPQFYGVQLLALLGLIALCVNIGMLVLARTATRSAELAVRTALGASRARVILQLFVESMVLAVLAAGVGLLIADQIASRSFGWGPGIGPSWVDLGVTPEAVLWAFALAVLSAAVVGVVPAFKATGENVQLNMSRASAGHSGVRSGGMSSAIIVADVALTVVILGVALGVRGPTIRDEMDIRPEQFLTAELVIPGEPEADRAGLSRTEFNDRLGATQQALVRRLAGEPGIGGMAVASRLPGMLHTPRRVEVDGESSSGDFENHRVQTARVDPDFFNALEQPVLNGRGFDLSDLDEDRSTVIVNTNFVDRVLGGRNAIGRRVRYTTSADEEPGPWYEIVGVVGHLGMGDNGDGGLYHPLAPGEIHPVLFAIHVGDDPESFVPRLRALTSEVDPTAMVSEPMVLSDLPNLEALLGQWVTLGALIPFGILLALSTMGIYALMSLAVAQRTREIGIRIALGARWRGVALAIAKRALVQLSLGVFTGIAIAGAVVSGLPRQAGGPWTDSPVVVTFFVGLGVMVLIGTLACIVPTLRALRITPTEALREGG